MEAVIQISPVDLDYAGSVMVIKLLDCMQRLADTHADILGIGREDLKKRNLVWMSARSAIVMEREIQLGEKITLRTWTGENTRASCPRYFLFIDEAGCEIGGGATTWMMIDPNTRRIVSPQKVDLPDIPVSEDVSSITMDQLPKLARIDIAEVRKPKYTDIDINGHVNNVSYVKWVLDALPIEIMHKHYVGALQINYHQEIRPEDVCVLEFQIYGSVVLVCGKSEQGKIFFEARIQMNPRK